MRYWVYINDKVDGPFEEEKLASLEGFTPETLICSEEIEEGGSQEWVKASSVFEFDEASKTMTRAPLTQEELNTVRGAADTASAGQQPAKAEGAENSATQILIEKIDNLTREIEGLKDKLDAALAAAARPAPEQPSVQTQTLPQPEPVTDEALITNTESLVNHAEQLVAEAGAGQTGKAIDFLDEIHIDSSKADNPSEKGGEEVVLRSALDSLYGAKEQTPEEKEATFQDLLSPVTTAAVAAAAGAAVTAAAMSPDKEEPKSETAAPEAIPSAEITEEKREEIINEITAPAQQDNLILQAIEEAKQQEKAPAEQPAPEQQPAPQPAAEEPQLDLPSLNAEQAAQLPQEPEKQSLDLNDGQPRLNIINDEPAPQQQPAPQPAAAEPASLPSAELTPMNPAEVQDGGQKEVTQTVKELVPGKKLESAQSEGLISQKDLDEAFTERAPVQEFTTPDTPQPSSLPEGKGFYNANDLTEVELKEGSTYLISDFIPPAEAKTGREAAATTDQQNLPGLQQSVQQAPAAEPEANAENVEEIVPLKKDNSDINMSKVILENTIKTKRGATMDIKTVPMVQEPADTERLDLSDSDLDINAQHDIKAADFKQSGSGVTKVILGSLVALVILALIYVMLAYLELLPANLNLLKSAPAAEQTLPEEQLNELLDTPAANPAPAYGQPMQLPDGAETQIAPQPVQAVNPLDQTLAAVKNYPMVNGQTLEQLINSRHPAAQGMVEWNITTAVEPDNYSVLVKIPPENPQSFKISYRFNYNTVTGALDPTISDSKNLLDSLRAPAGR